MQKERRGLVAAARRRLLFRPADERTHAVSLLFGRKEFSADLETNSLDDAWNEEDVIGSAIYSFGIAETSSSLILY